MKFMSAALQRLRINTSDNKIKISNSSRLVCLGYFNTDNLQQTGISSSINNSGSAAVDYIYSKGLQQTARNVPELTGTQFWIENILATVYWSACECVGFNLLLKYFLEPRFAHKALPGINVQLLHWAEAFIRIYSVVLCRLFLWTVRAMIQVMNTPAFHPSSSHTPTQMRKIAI